MKTLDQIASLTRDNNQVNYFSKLEKELNHRQERAMASNQQSHSILPSLGKNFKLQQAKKGELGKQPGDSSPSGKPFRPYLNKHVSLFKHLLEKPIVENPEEKEIRLKKEYLNIFFEEDFIKELCSLDRKIFLNLHALFKRIEMQ